MTCTVERLPFRPNRPVDAANGSGVDDSRVERGASQAAAMAATCTMAVQTDQAELGEVPSHDDDDDLDQGQGIQVDTSTRPDPLSLSNIAQQPVYDYRHPPQSPWSSHWSNTTQDLLICRRSADSDGSSPVQGAGRTLMDPSSSYHSRLDLIPAGRYGASHDHSQSSGLDEEEEDDEELADDIYHDLNGIDIDANSVASNDDDGNGYHDCADNDDDDDDDGNLSCASSHDQSSSLLEDDECPALEEGEPDVNRVVSRSSAVIPYSSSTVSISPYTSSPFPPIASSTLSSDLATSSGAFFDWSSGALSALNGNLSTRTYGQLSSPQSSSPSRFTMNESICDIISPISRYRSITTPSIQSQISAAIGTMSPVFPHIQQGEADPVRALPSASVEGMRRTFSALVDNMQSFRYGDGQRNRPIDVGEGR